MGILRRVVPLLALALAAAVAFWGDWRRVGFAVLLPIYGSAAAGRDAGR